ncbi:MAG: polysaccharide biosynthesis tyrosine autokinase [Chloroflexi bacterium]|nr:polysaccharide biosynthesis tyrosine autokinase [Chloroflexota bacterium]
MELRRYLRILWHWAWLLILSTGLAAGASYLASRVQPPVYQASTKLLVSQGSNPLATDTYTAILGAERLARTYADLINSWPILERAAAKLGLDPGQRELMGNTDVRLIRDTQLLQVSVEHTDPQLATDLANAIAEAFIEENSAAQQGRFQASRENLGRQVEQLARELDQRTRALDDLKGQAAPAGQVGEARLTEIARLQKEIAEFQQTYANLLRSYEEIRVAEARSLNTVTVAQPARLPTTPIKPAVLLNTLLGAVVGLLLGLGIIVLLEYLDDTLSDPERVAQIVRLPTLALVGQFPSDLKSRVVVGTEHAPGESGAHLNGNGKHDSKHDGHNGYGYGYGYGHYHTSVVEAYRVLRTNLQFTGLERPLRSILMTSAGPGEGKSTTAANLAAALAQAGFRTLLIDADLRRPSVHQLFELPNRSGLTTLLLQECAAEEYLQATTVPNLRVLPSGPIPPNPSELLASRRMSARLKEFAQLADYVILDSPPVLLVSDPLALASQVDGVLLVINARGARSGAVLRAREALEKVGAHLAGTILNRFQQKSRGYYYPRYEYYYSSAAPSEKNGKGDVAAGKHATDGM